MKVLLITSSRLTGLNYHRQIVPFTNLDVDASAYPIWDFTWTDEFLKNFEMVSFLRTISLEGKTNEILERVKKLGIKVHFDIDDYWVLPVNHTLYHNFKAQDVSKQVVEALRGADLVTTSTKHLANVIKQHNENVYVLPNAIQPNEEQWQIVDNPNELMRFGYIAGVHHGADVEILKPNFDKLWKDKQSYGKFQLAPAGFNLNTHEGVSSMNPYYHYVEQLFTDNYKHIKDANYKEYLKSNSPIDNDMTFDRPYRRLWGLDTFNYGKIYNLIDVSLVPLQQNLFTACKSELKLIEAGFMKKAVIVSNVKPYDELANEYNSILINPNRNGIDWFVAMRNLIKEPGRVKDLGEAMYESVKIKHHIDTVNVERKQIFNKLCE